MKLIQKSFLFVVAGALVFTACKKDTPTPVDPNNTGGTNNPPAPTKTELLTQKLWKVQSTRLIETGRTDTQNVNIVGSANWRYAFRTDKTGTATGTFLNTGEFTWDFANTAQNSVTITKGSTNATYAFADSTLTRVVNNLTLTLVDANGNPVGQVTGTLIEKFDKVQ
jgi:hypothetical protein